MTPSPTRSVSSPRVLSDLFWMGRYAERAEHMARLLTVTRERWHEYRYRREMAGSECVPVLLKFRRNCSSGVVFPAVVKLAPLFGSASM